MDGLIELSDAVAKSFSKISEGVKIYLNDQIKMSKDAADAITNTGKINFNNWYDYYLTKYYYERNVLQA